MTDERDYLQRRNEQTRLESMARQYIWKTLTFFGVQSLSVHPHFTYNMDRAGLAGCYQYLGGRNGSGRIFINLASAKNDTELCSTASHEASHVVRYVRGGSENNRNVLDRILQEGLANATARELTGNLAPEHSYYGIHVPIRHFITTDAHLSEVGLLELRKNPMKIYQIGLYVVDQALRQAGADLPALMGMPTEGIVEASAIK